ncbi:MAG: ACP S-malonyltransferase [Coprococcus sp.]
MSKIAFVYPGQGAQKAGMGKDFYDNSELAKDVYDKATEALQIDMKALCFEENDQLDLTEYTQAAMVTTCLAMTKVIEAKGLKPDVTAGLSLGEYCAISVAGGMKEEDAIRLVRKRGILMQNTVPAGKGAMAAVLGAEISLIESCIQDIDDASIANYNCPGQTVITGSTKAVEQAVEALKAAGVRRAVMLNVSGPFHSPLLKPAGEELAKELEKTEFTPLNIPYVTNVTAEYVTDIGKTRDLLARQVAAPVRWQESMEAMIADGVDTFVEIGPGRTLAGFMRKINRNVKMYNIGSWEEAEKVVSELTASV